MDLIHNKTLLKTYEDNIKTFGHYNRFPESEFPAGGSTDMGNVSYVVPSIHPMFYIGSDAFNHSKEFTKATGKLEVTKYMVVYFCHHLSDNYVDLSDFYVDLSIIYVDLSNHYVNLSEKYHHN